MEAGASLQSGIMSSGRYVSNVIHTGLTVVCQIPKTALLSTRTSSLPPLLPDENLGPKSSHTILLLALALLHELRLGPTSPFYGYLQSLPRDTILLPAFWTIGELAGDDGRKARAVLSGTEAERDIFRKNGEGLGIVRPQSDVSH